MSVCVDVLRHFYLYQKVLNRKDSSDFIEESSEWHEWNAVNLLCKTCRTRFAAESILREITTHTTLG